MLSIARQDQYVGAFKSLSFMNRADRLCWQSGTCIRATTCHLGNRLVWVIKIDELRCIPELTAIVNVNTSEGGISRNEFVETFEERSNSPVVRLIEYELTQRLKGRRLVPSFCGAASGNFRRQYSCERRV